MGSPRCLRRLSRKKRFAFCCITLVGVVIVVGILGGSVAWHIADSGKQAFVRALKESSHFQDREIVVVRLALSAYKQPQQLIVLNYLMALGAEFDVVVNIDGYNEIALYPIESLPLGVFYAYPQGWFTRGRGQPSPEIAKTVYRNWNTESARKSWAMLFSQLPYRNSSTLNLIWRCRDRILEDSVNRDNEAIFTHEQQGLTYQETGPLRRYTRREPLVEDLVSLWKKCSLQLHQLCEANEIQYHHVLQPNQYYSSKPMGNEEREKAILNGSSYGLVVEDAYPELIQHGADLARKGVRFHDMTQIFNDVAEPIYVDHFCHVNLQGNEMLAGAIAREIINAWQ